MAVMRLEWRVVEQRADGTVVKLPHYVEEEEEPVSEERCGCCCHDEAGPCHECFESKIQVESTTRSSTTRT